MNTRLGLFGISGIWLTMSMMSLAVLMPFNAFQLLILRGLSGVVFFGAASISPRYRIAKPDRNLMLFMLCFVVATFGLFQGFKAWGPSLTAVLLDMAVLVNFLFASVRKEKAGTANKVLFGTAIIGSFIALRGWDVHELNVAGLLWSLVALVANGLGIEYGSRARQDIETKVFWLSAALSIFGLAGVAVEGAQSWNIGDYWLKAFVFSISTGLLNSLCGFIAFSNLKPTWTGTLVLGVTPSIMLSSWLLTGKVIGVDQMIGVVINSCSIGYFMYLLNKSRSA